MVYWLPDLVCRDGKVCSLPRKKNSQRVLTGIIRAPFFLNCMGDLSMNLHLSLTPLISLIAGILVLIMPRLLNYIVAIYLIAIGLVGLLGAGAFQFK
jgi:hypothetical protein